MTLTAHLRGKSAARWIFQETLKAIDLPGALARCVERSDNRIRCGSSTADLSAFREILAIAIGKAAAPMASAFNAILAPDFQVEGILAAPVAPSRTLPGWQVFAGGHPIPNAESFRAGRAILDRVSRADERTLTVCLLSGGGSALAEFPLHAEISLSDFQQLNQALITCGAPIEEINAVRKHLSALKGGRLAAAAPRATKFTYGVSDVPPGHESALASGPTLPDPTTVADAVRVIDEYDLRENLAPSIRNIFDKNALRETPKPGDPAFAHARFQLVLGHHELTHAAHHAAECLGYMTICDDATDGWPLGKAADYLLGSLARLRAANPTRPVCVIADGEVSSPVTGKGIGGRNSALVLEFVEKITGSSIVVLSAGTDGIDGNSPAAGAVADGGTLARAKSANLSPGDFSAHSDAYNFFRHLGDTIETGPTGNNLRDLRILLSE